MLIMAPTCEDRHVVRGQGLGCEADIAPDWFSNWFGIVVRIVEGLVSVVPCRLGLWDVFRNRKRDVYLMRIELWHLDRILGTAP